MDCIIDIMVRPLTARDRDYARFPLNACFGAPSHVAVLRTLFWAGGGMTGRQIARMSGVAVGAGLETLGRLEEAGLVRWLPQGRAHVYELCRDHVLVKGGLGPAFEAESGFRAGIRRLLKESLKGRVRAAALFGSVARREDRPDSDLDLVLVVDRERDLEAAQEAAQAVSGRLRKEFGVRLAPLVFSLPEFKRQCRQGSSFFKTLLKEAEGVTGAELEELGRG